MPNDITNFYNHPDQYLGQSHIELMPSTAKLGPSDPRRAIEEYNSDPLQFQLRVGAHSKKVPEKEYNFIRALFLNDGLEEVSLSKRVRTHDCKMVVFPILALILTVKPNVSIKIAGHSISLDNMLSFLSTLPRLNCKGQKRSREEESSFRQGPGFFQRFKNTKIETLKFETGEISKLLNGLGLSKDQDSDTLKKALSKKMKSSHPDKTQGSDELRLTFENAKELYDLVNNGKHAIYLDKLRELAQEQQKVHMDFANTMFQK